MFTNFRDFILYAAGVVGLTLVVLAALYLVAAKTAGAFELEELTAPPVTIVEVVEVAARSVWWCDDDDNEKQRGRVETATLVFFSDGSVTYREIFHYTRYGSANDLIGSFVIPVAPQIEPSVFLYLDTVLRVTVRTRSLKGTFYASTAAPGPLLNPDNVHCVIETRFKGRR